MQQVAKSKTSTHKKLKIVLGLIALLVAGFFIYKYTYIYVERRKYDQAAVAINKVAADLRAEGINTEFSKGCGKNQEVFGEGALNCSTGITYSSDSKENRIREILISFMKYMKDTGFVMKNGSLDPNSSPILTGSSEYTLVTNPLNCSLFFSTTDISSKEKNQIDLYCAATSMYKLF